MKHPLLFGVAAGALLAAPQAYAQAGKDGDSLNLMNQTRRAEATPSQPMVQTRTTRTEIRRIEPAAGGSRDEGLFSNFTGFYAGADIGYGIGSYDVDNPADANGDVGLSGFDGTGFVGYGFEYDFGMLGGYAGLEIAYEWSGMDGEIGSYELDKNSAINVSFKPGLAFMTDVMGYGIIGYSRAEFEDNQGSDENLNGLILGLGTELNTNTPFGTRLEYVYTNYEDADLGGVDFDGQESALRLGVMFRI